MGYGLGRSPFFVWGGIWGGKFGHLYSLKMKMEKLLLYFQLFVY